MRLQLIEPLQDLIEWPAWHCDLGLLEHDEAIMALGSEFWLRVSVPSDNDPFHPQPENDRHTGSAASRDQPLSLALPIATAVCRDGVTGGLDSVHQG